MESSSCANESKVADNTNCDDINNCSDKEILCNSVTSKHLTNHSDSKNASELDKNKVLGPSTSSAATTASTSSTTNSNNNTNFSSNSTSTSNNKKENKEKDSNSDKSSKSSSEHHSAFNTLTQRLTNFSFNSNNSEKDKSVAAAAATTTAKTSSSNKRNFISLTSKSNSSNNNNNSLIVNNHLNNNTSNSNGQDINSLMTSSLTKNKANVVMTSYDPMKLIGTPACPRFDECPVLEPLVCKKIAHERLTALIFREDCFLTACQDGFVYTWARPGYFVSLYLT